MLTVGITGGIGSGKSTVCRFFRILGIPVFQADLEARRLQEEDMQVRNGLIALFGPEIYHENGQLDRKRLAEIIFNNALSLEKVNHLIHPAVHREFERWKNQLDEFPYALYEAAILFETGSSSRFDYTILVVAEEKERLDRIKKRDNLPDALILQRMNNQMKDAEKIKLADFIIENNDNQLIIPQALKLDQILKSI
jgi:dephospho-CoA kinase